MMKCFGWICLVLIACFSISWTYYSIKENQVESGRIEKIEIVEDSDGKHVFITISGWAKNNCTYERRVEFNGPEMPVLGQEVDVEKPKELKPRVVIRKRSEGAILDKDGWPREEKKE